LLPPLFSLTRLCPPISPLFPYTTLFRSILIFLYIHSELRYDSVFPKPAQTYRLALKITNAQGDVSYDNTMPGGWGKRMKADLPRSEEHTSELQSRENLVCRLLLEKKKK